VSKAISVLLVDDHAMVRGMLRSLLDNTEDIEVIAAVSNAGDAVTEVIRHQPDILLMDIDLPGLNCFEAVQTIRVRCPQTRTVFLSAFFHDRYIEQALEVQAWGYITKSESEESILKAIRKVHSGVAYFSPEVQARIVVDANGAKLANKIQSRTSTLTDRELEVLRYLARGMQKKEIGQVMYISVNTVNRHTTSLMNKLNIHDRVELARFAIREGLAEA
jgi:DNA-binding NarL/FixJ family response regulator